MSVCKRVTRLGQRAERLWLMSALFSASWHPGNAVTLALGGCSSDPKGRRLGEGMAVFPPEPGQPPPHPAKPLEVSSPSEKPLVYHLCTRLHWDPSLGQPQLCGCSLALHFPWLLSQITTNLLA